MSDLVHIANSLVCPGIDFNPERDTHDAWESIDFLWTYLSDFGYQHCIYGCIGCLERMGKDDKKHLPPEPAGNYRSAFADLHEALGQLPENLFRHLSDISNSDCPACAVLTALQQFSTIARYSENKPVGWEALPCYFEEDIDQRGDYFWNSVRHIDALRNLDLSKLPPRMPPAERRDVKARLAPGKAVVEFIHDFHKRQVQLPPTMSDDELWAVLACSDQIRTLNKNNLFVSPRWKSWAKESILNGDNGGKGAFVSRVGLVAFDCYRNIQEARDNAHFGMWMPEVSEYGVILSILTAAYFYSSGVALTEQGSDVWFEKAAQGFIVFDRDDFGKRYYGISGLGRALALRNGGSPPPFLQQEAEKGVGPAPHPTPPPITVTSTDVIDNDNTANSNAQAAAFGGDGGKAKAISAPVVTAAPVAKIEEGANRNNNVITTNIAGQGDVVKETRETVFQTLSWVEEKFGVPIGIPKENNCKDEDAQRLKDDREQDASPEAADRGGEDKQDEYDGPEPVVDSPERRFDPATMIKTKDLCIEYNRLYGGNVSEGQVRRTMGDYDVPVVYEKKGKGGFKAYDRIKALGAMAERAKSE